MQKVNTNGCFSNYLPISATVPRGSILGRRLFNVFINDVFQFNSASSEIHLYADDTAIIFNAKSNSAQRAVLLLYYIQRSVCSNCIVVNPIKPSHWSFNADNIVLTINNHLIVRANVAKYLGLYIDDELAWKLHIIQITKSCSPKISVFKKLLSFLPDDVLPLYCNAFIRSSFLYWINNDQSGHYKLIDKIDNLLPVIRKRFYKSQMVDSVVMHDVWAVYKLQCVSFFV